ncbi:hypothetical protein RYX56_24330, partial [Alkalihalophilus lindianensis]
FPARTARLHALVSLLAEPAARVALFTARGDRTSVRESLRGYRMLWREARALLRGEVSTGPYVPSSRSHL